MYNEYLNTWDDTEGGTFTSIVSAGTNIIGLKDDETTLVYNGAWESVKDAYGDDISFTSIASDGTNIIGLEEKPNTFPKTYMYNGSISWNRIYQTNKNISTFFPAEEIQNIFPTGHCGDYMHTLFDMGQKNTKFCNYNNQTFRNIKQTTEDLHYGTVIKYEFEENIKGKQNYFVFNLENSDNPKEIKYEFDYKISGTHTGFGAFVKIFSKQYDVDDFKDFNIDNEIQKLDDSDNGFEEEIEEMLELNNHINFLGKISRRNKRKKTIHVTDLLGGNKPITVIFAKIYVQQPLKETTITIYNGRVEVIKSLDLIKERVDNDVYDNEFKIYEVAYSTTKTTDDDIDFIHNYNNVTNCEYIEFVNIKPKINEDMTKFNLDSDSDSDGGWVKGYKKTDNNKEILNNIQFKGRLLNDDFGYYAVRFYSEKPNPNSYWKYDKTDKGGRLTINRSHDDISNFFDIVKDDKISVGGTITYGDGTWTDWLEKVFKNGLLPFNYLLNYGKFKIYINGKLVVLPDGKCYTMSNPNPFAGEEDRINFCIGHLDYKEYTHELLFYKKIIIDFEYEAIEHIPSYFLSKVTLDFKFDTNVDANTGKKESDYKMRSDWQKVVLPMYWILIWVLFVIYFIRCRGNPIHAIFRYEKVWGKNMRVDENEAYIKYFNDYAYAKNAGDIGTDKPLKINFENAAWFIVTFLWFTIISIYWVVPYFIVLLLVLFVYYIGWFKGKVSLPNKETFKSETFKSEFFFGKKITNENSSANDWFNNMTPSIKVKLKPGTKAFIKQP